MSQIADPYKGLVSFQRAYKAGSIALRPCTGYADLKVTMDDAAGEVRLTYALIGQAGEVKAIVAYIPTEPQKGKHCFQVAYAVSALMRNKGLASEALRKSIEEMRHRFMPLIGEFYIEAVVGEGNVASVKVASKIISSFPKKIMDGPTGEQAMQFLLLVE